MVEPDPITLNVCATRVVQSRRDPIVARRDVRYLFQPLAQGRRAGACVNLAPVDCAHRAPISSTKRHGPPLIDSSNRHRVRTLGTVRVDDCGECAPMVVG